jgi:hypothetical protein
MNVFAIIATSSVSIPAIGQALATTFPNDFMIAGDRLWFASDTVTTFEFATKLGVKGKAGGHISQIVIIPVTTYWGSANPEIWEWINSRLEK